MRKQIIRDYRLILILLLTICSLGNFGCQPEIKDSITETQNSVTVEKGKPEFYYFREQFEKTQGYTHAVKVGDILRISGAVSMDENGKPIAEGDLKQQLKNCYASLEVILNQYGATFDDVIMENIYTTDMPTFLENKDYRQEIYTKQFPAGNWVGVNELVLPELVIEIGLEVYIPGP